MRPGGTAHRDPKEGYYGATLSSARASRHSVDQVLELFQSEHLHGLRCGLRFEHTGLLGEGINALTRWPCGFRLQLQVQGPTELEGTLLLHLRRGDADVSLHSTFDVACFDTRGLRHRAVGGGCRHGFGARRLHGLRCLHGPWRQHIAGEDVARVRVSWYGVAG